MSNVTVISQYFAGKRANIPHSEERSVIAKNEDGDEFTEFESGAVAFDEDGYAEVSKATAKALVASYPKAVSILKPPTK